MERRKAIKNIGLTFGAFVGTPAALSVLQSCETEIPWTPVFLTKDEGIVLKELADTILPASGELPSATEVNVHAFIDKFINEVMSLEDQENQRIGITSTIEGLLSAAGKEAIDDLNNEDYESFLAANLRKTKAEEEATQESIGDYMEQNENSAGMPEELKIYSFLSGLRGMSIWAYKGSERVGETILAYKPIPSQQQGCIPVEEATGGKAWSL